MANKKCLVFETMNNINSTMSIVESSNPKELRLTGVFGVAGIKNNNNRIYDKQNYGMMVESLQKVIANEGCLGELEHPNSMNINLNNVSHKIESIEMLEDGTVQGTIVLLDTDKGRNAKAIIEGGVPLYISSRAAGSIDESGHVTLTSLKTYDLVGTPGFSQARLNLSENQTFEALNESLCVIYEGEDDTKNDDLLGGNDNGETETQKKEEDKDNNPKKEETKADDKDSKEKDNKEDNNKNNKDKEATMDDLKKAIDELTAKVESLQADLHVANESLENKQKEIDELKESVNGIQIPELNYDAIQKWITEEYAPEFKEEIMGEVNESIDKATEVIGEGMQNWTVNEFAPMVEKYIIEEFAPEVQNWICEEFAPEVQNWVVEEFSPEVQNWVVEEFAPEVENWINEELMPVVDTWINEECIPEHKTNIINEVNENVNQFLESQKVEKLSSIDNLLEAIENKDKDEVIEQLKENKTVDEKYRGLYVVENMPAEYTPSWQLLNEQQKEDIIRRSRMYDFTKDGVLESFWASIDFNKITEVKENLEEKTIDSYHAGIFAKMRSLRKA